MATSGRNTIPQITQQLGCVIVPPEANSAGKLRGDSKPWPKGGFNLLRRNAQAIGGTCATGLTFSRTESWKRIRHKLAPANKGEREVKKIAAELLRPMNQGLQTIGSATLFSDYVQNTYGSTLLSLMAKSTRDRYDGIIRNYLTPAFGSKCLRDLSPLTLQQYFSSVSDSKLSYESRDKIRDVLSSILASAVTYGLLVKNPAEGVKLAPAKRGNRIKPFLEPTKFMALLALIPEPYSTMVHVAVYMGPRASEVIGLRWGNVGVDSIAVAERYCRGDWGCTEE
jgi:Phage integrase, N-terminal SAM-like domain